MSWGDNDDKTLQLVKIIEKFPDIYDRNKETYRKWAAQKSWDKVADCVKEQLQVDCTVEQLKIKWKSIRTSFSRYRSKFIHSSPDTRPKKYYLYDHLKFIEPFTRTKNIYELANANVVETSKDNQISDSSEDDSNIVKWTYEGIKEELKTETISDDENDQDLETEQETIIIDKNQIPHSNTTRKRRLSAKNESVADNDDLQFFKSILPDIRDFTSKEKRRLRMGILKLIDDIDNERNIDA